MTDKRFQLQELAHTAMTALIGCSHFGPAEGSKEAMDRWVADVCLLAHAFAIKMMETENAVVGAKTVEGLEEKEDEQ
jgi:hypothetical protein